MNFFRDVSSAILGLSLSLICSCASPSGTQEVGGLKEAALSYAKQNSDPSVQAKMKVEVKEVEGDYARVLVTSTSNDVDPADMYLRRTGGVWKGLHFGTGITTDDLRKDAIPLSLQP